MMSTQHDKEKAARKCLFSADSPSVAAAPAAASAAPASAAERAERAAAAAAAFRQPLADGTFAAEQRTLRLDGGAPKPLKWGFRRTGEEVLALLRAAPSTAAAAPSPLEQPASPELATATPEPAAPPKGEQSVFGEAAARAAAKAKEDAAAAHPRNREKIGAEGTACAELDAENAVAMEEATAREEAANKAEKAAPLDEEEDVVQLFARCASARGNLAEKFTVLPTESPLNRLVVLVGECLQLIGDDAMEQGGFFGLLYDACDPAELTALGDMLPAFFRNQDVIDNLHAIGAWCNDAMIATAELVTSYLPRGGTAVVVGAAGGLGADKFPADAILKMFDINPPLKSSHVVRCKGDATPLPGLDKHSADAFAFTCCCCNPQNVLQQLSCALLHTKVGGIITVADFANGHGAVGLRIVRDLLTQMQQLGVLTDVEDQRELVDASRGGKGNSNVRILAARVVNIEGVQTLHEHLELSLPTVVELCAPASAPEEHLLPKLREGDEGKLTGIAALHWHRESRLGTPGGYLLAARSFDGGTLLAYAGSTLDLPTRLSEHATGKGNKDVGDVCAERGTRPLSAVLAARCFFDAKLIDSALFGGVLTVHRLELFTRMAEKFVLSVFTQLVRDAAIVANATERTFTNNTLDLHLTGYEGTDGPAARAQRLAKVRGVLLTGGTRAHLSAPELKLMGCVAGGDTLVQPALLEAKQRLVDAHPHKYASTLEEAVRYGKKAAAPAIRGRSSGKSIAKEVVAAAQREDETEQEARKRLASAAGGLANMATSAAITATAENFAKRQRITGGPIDELETIYQSNKKFGMRDSTGRYADLVGVVADLGWDVRKVKTWFEHRRRSEKRAEDRRKAKLARSVEG